MGAETNLKDRVAKYLKRLQPRHKLWFYKVHGSGMQKMGIPDLCVVFYGVPVFIELKATAAGEPTKIQLARMKQIEAAGGYCAVACTVERVREILLEAWEFRFSELHSAAGLEIYRPILEPVK